MLEPQQIQVLSLKSLVSFFNQCSSALSMISVRYGTVFLQNPGLPVFFGTVLALYFGPRFFWKLFDIFQVFFIGAISYQFREFPQFLGLLFIRKNFVHHHNKHYYQWGKVK